MGDIIEFSKFKSQEKIAHKLSQKEMADLILDSQNYNNRNIAIPIVKIAQSYGLKVYNQDFYSSGDKNIAGKLLVGGNTEELYNYNKVIIVNKDYHIFEKRIVIAKMLACYLINIKNKNCSLEEFTSISVNKEKIFDKYEEFIINILAPSEIFVKQYNVAANDGVSQMFMHCYFIYEYLKRYFEVTDEFVQRKIKSLNRQF